MEFCFCVILQGIQNVFGPGTPRILLGALGTEGFLGHQKFRTLYLIMAAKRTSLKIFKDDLKRWIP